MTSKQEKLAAARKKLKEFQEKNRDVSAKQTASFNANGNTHLVFPKELSHSSCEFLPPLPINDSNRENGKKNFNMDEGNPVAFDQLKNKDSTVSLNPSGFMKKPNSPVAWAKGSCLNDTYNKDLLFNDSGSVSEKTSEEENIFFNKLNLSFPSGSVESFIHEGCENLNSINPCFVVRGNNKTLPQTEQTKTDLNNENLSLYKDDDIISDLKESTEFINTDLKTSNVINDMVKPLQLELQSHAQTINILIQQRNDAQNALAQAHNLLSEKTGEIEGLNQHIVCLTSSINNIQQKLLENEKFLENSTVEKGEALKKYKESEAIINSLKAQLDSKEEEYLEVKRKYDERNKEYQQLSSNLQRMQSQLSLCQIQMQQFSNGEHSTLTVQVSELQNENLNLKQKIENLEKKIEVQLAEQESSSQTFHMYAQQCNSQISSLNSQLKTLAMENDRLNDLNATLSKNLSELESQKNKNLSIQPSETQTADFDKQMSTLSEENNHLLKSLDEKEEELIYLCHEREEKDLKIENMKRRLNELEVENQKLVAEVETPSANERLLATMESDKVAAAKAVSQNQKLKEQVAELEKAFMKLSEEKLELTNQLAHEKHINVELQKLMENVKSHQHNYDYNHHNDPEESSCHHTTDEKIEPLINDSNEIEELRSIIRQLQDDKMELKARLDSLIVDNTVPDKEKEGEKCKHDAEENETDSENAKLLLQQMEEKVRRTMNEIAVLDEEKEKLEHLVLQLQGETETIGEYITLYQRQRMLLRQRAQEKDNQLLQLSKDKEELRSKLVALDELVQHLIAERQNTNPYLGSYKTTAVETSENTAGKIKALINEIGSTTLVSSNSVAFEHCSCCSGRLITV